MKMENAEQFNVLTSRAGVLAAVAGMVVLVPTAIRQGDPWKVVSFGIYGLSLLSLYTHSTLYHLLSGKAKQVFKELDRDSIFILIAGTYTPFSLVTLRGVWGWTLFGVVWGGALIGIAKERWPGLLPRVPEMAIYLMMGWLVLIAIVPLMRALPLPGVGFLLLGGLFYTGGIFFYLLDNKIAWFHGLWHLCVLAGSISHYLAVCLFIA